MGVQELRHEIDGVLQTFDRKELEVILSLLKQMKDNPKKTITLIGNLQKIILEDASLLKRLAK